MEALYLLMTGAYPILPKLEFEIVDVRDVAVLHRLALETPEAAGQRYMCANGFRWFVDILRQVKSQHPQLKVPTSQMPNWIASIAGMFLKEIKQFLQTWDALKKSTTRLLSPLVGNHVMQTQRLRMVREVWLILRSFEFGRGAKRTGGRSRRKTLLSRRASA